MVFHDVNTDVDTSESDHTNTDGVSHTNTSTSSMNPFLGDFGDGQMSNSSEVIGKKRRNNQNDATQTFEIPILRFDEKQKKHGGMAQNSIIPQNTIRYVTNLYSPRINIHIKLGQMSVASFEWQSHKVLN